VSALHPEILIVDADPQVRRYLQSAMASAGYRPCSIDNAASVLDIVKAHPPDAMVLDLHLTGADAKTLLKQARKTFQGPILVVSAGGRKIEQIDALDLGADAVFIKPFSAEELLARLRVAFRQRIVCAGGKPIVEAADLTIDRVKRVVRLKDRLVSLSEQQYSVLIRLAEGGGAVLTHQDLLGERQAQKASRSLQSVRLLIRQLREKLEEDPKRPRIIQTQHGLGYRLVVDR
jgi:two-component system KDP operon response regulator KdpE